MRFVEMANGCWLCLSHLPNHDGYLRKAWGTVARGSRVSEMFHRFIYRAHHGEIPEGHEVDHECGNRGCCAPGHLRALPRTEHLILTNQTRYRAHFEKAREYWLEHRPTGTALAEKFGVSFSIGCRWIREWKLQAER
jgi:hypothetical protein